MAIYFKIYGDKIPEEIECIRKAINNLGWKTASGSMDEGSEAFSYFDRSAGTSEDVVISIEQTTPEDLEEIHPHQKLNYVQVRSIGSDSDKYWPLFLNCVTAIFASITDPIAFDNNGIASDDPIILQNDSEVEGLVKKYENQITVEGVLTPYFVKNKKAN